MYKRLSVIASAIVWIMLPKCSACLVAYIGLFSALGLGNVISNPYALPVIESLLVINVAASLYLAFKAKQYVYAGMSFLCSVIFIINKLYMQSAVINIVTIAVLVIAMLRVRLLNIKKHKCLFDKEPNVHC